ncbi:MAG: DUF192 domain-containing protein [Minisyncoccia bacterium]
MKNKFINFLVVIMFLGVGVFLVGSAPKNFKPEDIKYVKIAGKEIKVELALTEVEQNKGLSGRSNLMENSGMLFVFDKPEKYSFWMKDMKFSIDIIWISEEMKVVYVAQDTQPETFPKTFGPEMDAKYVLEVEAGFSGKNNLKAGDEVLFTY